MVVASLDSAVSLKTLKIIIRDFLTALFGDYQDGIESFCASYLVVSKDGCRSLRLEVSPQGQDNNGSTWQIAAFISQA